MQHDLTLRQNIRKLLSYIKLSKSSIRQSADLAKTSTSERISSAFQCDIVCSETSLRMVSPGLCFECVCF